MATHSTKPHTDRYPAGLSTPLVKGLRRPGHSGRGAGSGRLLSVGAPLCFSEVQASVRGGVVFAEQNARCGKKPRAVETGNSPPGVSAVASLPLAPPRPVPGRFVLPVLEEEFVTKLSNDQIIKRSYNKRGTSLFMKRAPAWPAGPAMRFPMAFEGCLFSPRPWPAPWHWSEPLR